MEKAVTEQLARHGQDAYTGKLNSRNRRRRSVGTALAIFIDAYGEYDNCWGVTDNYSSDCLHLKMGVDFTEMK